MCGIFGYVGAGDDAAGIVLHGLKKLEYRGYDSWGIAVARAGEVVLEKRIGKIGDAAPELPASVVGLGHTRWATHGGVTAPNAHPHLDCGGRLAVIHNGIISNYRELRRPLTGHRFRSETDTEVVAHLLEDCLRETPPGPEQLVHATMTVFRRLEGLNAIAVLDASTGQIAAAKSGSPLVLGWSDGAHMLASDYSALLEHTRRVTFVEERQAVLVSREGSRLFDVDTGRELTPDITEVEWEAAATELCGYPGHRHPQCRPRAAPRLLPGPAARPRPRQAAEPRQERHREVKGGGGLAPSRRGRLSPARVVRYHTHARTRGAVIKRIGKVESKVESK